MKISHLTTFHLLFALLNILFCKRIFYIFLLIFFIKDGYSQSLSASTQKKIDSLKIELQTAKDTNEVKILLNISTTYYWTFLFPDSVFKYSNLVISKTDQLKCNTYWKASALSVLGLYYNFDPPESLKYHFAALKIRRQIRDKIGESASLHNIANIYSYRMGYYAEALRYNLESLKIREELKNSYLIRASYANIAHNFISERKYDEALKYYRLMGSLQVSGLARSEEAGRLRNMGICYCNLSMYEEGLKYLFDGLKIEQNVNDNLGMDDFNVSIGNCYARLAASLSPADEGINI